LLPFAVESCGGLAPDAQLLLKTIGEAGEEHLSVWSKDTVARHLQDRVAVAIQRGCATMYQHLYGLVLRKWNMAAGYKECTWREKGDSYNLWRKGEKVRGWTGKEMRRMR
jgi:hypothetical protein